MINDQINLDGDPQETYVKLIELEKKARKANRDFMAKTIREMADKFAKEKFLNPDFVTSVGYLG